VNSPATVVVVAAAIVAGDPPRVLAAQRAHPAALAGRWELPGGKVEPGERELDALVRECQEELGVTLVVGPRAAPDVATVDGSGVLKTFWARIAGSTSPVAHEHSALRWLTAGELDDVDWLDADLPVVRAIRQGITCAP
jgi:8-oxo-dGTP diphosphatase